jgi:pantoate--beta-alanine ligase
LLGKVDGVEIVRRVQAMREISKQARARKLKIGFVPTMGFLHEGHVSLIRKVDELADIVVVSIFVNPTQFGPEEDFDRYPRDLTRDVDLCIAEGVDYLFTPGVDEIYPPGPPTYVEVTGLSGRLEGASRPGHFRGVTTVVLKLFEVVRPHIAAFGQKDAQQAVIVRRMVSDLLLDVELLVLPTVRDERDVALSSRNRYLSPEQHEAATAIPRALEAARHVVNEGQTDAEEVLEAAREVIEAERLLRLDYLELVDPEKLEPVSVVDREVLLLIAVFCGEIRLLDNTHLKPA